MPKRLTDDVGDWVLLVIQRYLEFRPPPSYQVTYDLAFQAFPDDEGRFFGQIAIYLQIAGLEQGTSIWAMPILSPLGINKEAVHEAVHQALEDMHAEREKQRPQTEVTG